jgi:hypothetical protein
MKPFFGAAAGIEKYLVNRMDAEFFSWQSGKHPQKYPQFSKCPLAVPGTIPRACEEYRPRAEKGVK